MTKKVMPHAVVLGLGKTGLSCARFLCQRGYDVQVLDTRGHPPMEAELARLHPEIKLISGEFEADIMRQADLLVVSPGISLEQAAVRETIAAGADVVGDIELFARNVTAPVVAITGSNGKSTVTRLVNDIIRHAGVNVAMGGNIGIPALDLVTSPEPDVYVLELSSFQLESTYSLQPKAAVVLNISPDHMDRYDDLNAYAEAKGRIFNGNGAMVLNLDDPLVAAMAQPGRETRWFSLGAPGNDATYGIDMIDGKEWLLQGSRKIMPAAEVRLAGRHNLGNALAAIALVESIGVDISAATDVLRQFRGLPHRTEIVAESDGVQWINDSKGTNVGSTIAALRGIGRPVILIAGGQGKGADFGPLGDAISQFAKATILFGEDAEKIAGSIPPGSSVERVDDLMQAVVLASRLAKPGDAVLLSPACASFDMFLNFEHRGDMFRSYVEDLLRGAL